MKKTRARPANDFMDGRDFVTHSTTFHFRYPSLDRSDILERHAITLCRKSPVLSTLWYIQNEHDIGIWSDNVEIHGAAWLRPKEECNFQGKGRQKLGEKWLEGLKLKS